MLTTNQGVAIADNQNSLSTAFVAQRCWRDFILRKTTTSTMGASRVVYARGSAAHGTSEVL
jgi:catalase